MSQTLNSLSRRGFLQTSAATGLVISLEWPARGADVPAQLAGWVHLAPDGVATILTNTSEIGQGTSTALAQLLADELDLPWQDVRLAMAPIDTAHVNPGFGEYATYGSGGVALQADMFRTAGARARSMLIDAAAQAWKVPAAHCTTKDGMVIHAPSQRKIAYGGLARSAARFPVPAKPALKSRETWRYIGRPMPRLDLPSKTDGSGVYGIDVKLPGLKIATIAQCPVFGGRLRSLNSALALAVPGVERVVSLKSAVAVVASGYWAAKKGLNALTPHWDLSGGSKAQSKIYDEQLAATVTAGRGAAYAPDGSTVAGLARAHAAAMSGAQRQLAALYQVPFAAHATMEPMNATARPVPGGMELWLPTQAQSATRDAVAKLIGVPAKNVIVHTTLAGGGFGRRAELDFPLQAAEIAHKIGAPVKLIWSREEDIQHDWYRPAAAIRIEAGVNGDGMPVAWHFETACESILEWSRYGADKASATPVDSTALSGLVSTPYRLAAPRYGWTKVDADVPVTFWRSVGRSQNVFALESFIDELAGAAKSDPFAYRMWLFGNHARERRVLESAARKAGWSKPVRAGRVRGMAMAIANGTAVAHVIELTVNERQQVQLHRVTCAVDCGLAINPNSVAAQMEGGIAFGLTHAFFSEITLDGGKVQQSNFHNYPLITLSQMPEIDVIILESEAKIGGSGEEAVAAVAPAVGNAIFAATGKRIRRLPFVRAGFALA